MKSSAEPPQHLEKTVSYESSQAEMGKIHKKAARNTVDAELAAVLEMVRRSMSSRGGETSLKTELFPSAGNRARRHHQGGEQAPERTRQQACPQHHARHLLLAGAAFSSPTVLIHSRERSPETRPFTESRQRNSLVCLNYESDPRHWTRRTAVLLAHDRTSDPSLSFLSLCA